MAKSVSRTSDPYILVSSNLLFCKHDIVKIINGYASLNVLCCFTVMLLNLYSPSLSLSLSSSSLFSKTNFFAITMYNYVAFAHEMYFNVNQIN